jgi:hypothetical protein
VGLQGFTSPAFYKLAVAAFGAIHALVALGVGGGPLLVSIVYDRSHSYSLVLWAAVPILIIVALMFLSLGKRPRFKTESPMAAQAAL